jgi:hypothetical protein
VRSPKHDDFLLQQLRRGSVLQPAARLGPPKPSSVEKESTVRVAAYQADVEEHRNYVAAVRAAQAAKTAADVVEARRLRRAKAAQATAAAMVEAARRKAEGQSKSLLLYFCC